MKRTTRAWWILVLVAGAFWWTGRSRGPATPRPLAPPDTDARVAWISQGEVVDLARYVRRGVWTVFEYTADW